MLDANAATTQPAGRAREDLLERVDDFDLGSRPATPIDVGAVGKERQHALCAKRREPVEVEVLAVERRLVHLEVAGVNDDAGRRVQRQGDAVRHAVRHADELDLNRADRDPIAGTDRLKAIVGIDPVLLELRPDERQRERRSVDLSVEERHQVWHAADVVLVPVREHQRGNSPVLQIGQILDDPIHARQLGPGEHATGVDDDGGLAGRDGEHVEPEFAEAAEGHDFDGWSAGLSARGVRWSSMSQRRRACGRTVR